MAKVYYVGDWAVMLGPCFAETPFNYSFKGTDVFNYGKWLKEALEATGEHEVVSVPTWEFYRNPPGRYEEILAEFDVLIFSDVEIKNFQLDPTFFDRSKFGTEPLTFPDRVRLTVEAIEQGTHALFLGGWLSFNGELGKGGWGRSQLAKALPVECLREEDLVESTEGFRMRGCVDSQAALQGTDLESAPPILGYNRTIAKPEAQVLATWEDTSDPALVLSNYGSGRVAAYTSDPAPHWGCNFVYWQGYERFWQQLMGWLLSGD